jgi:hypothetical protein
MTLYVNVYSAAQAYGGPEEGGWWFDTGVPVASIPVELEDHERDQFDREYHAEAGTVLGSSVDPMDYADALDQALKDKAWEVRNEWKQRYPFEMSQYTSVLSHRYDNYQVVIEDHFARPYPEERPHYE